MKLLDWLRGADYQRQRLLKRAPPGPFADYLARPFPSRELFCHEAEYLAIDLEATGLDLEQDEILSVGYVPLRHLSVMLSESAHCLVRPTHAIPEESAVVHRIFDDRSATGEALEAVLPRVLEALCGRVLLAHYARIEMGFLDAACRRIYGCGFIAPVMDTLALEQRWFNQRGQAVSTGGLRLATLRQYYNLPRYPAHNALSDAVAAGELFLAQVAHRSGGHPLKLGRVLYRGVF